MSELKFPDIPEDVLKWFNNIYREAFLSTIKDGDNSKRLQNSEEFRPADHLSLFLHMEKVFLEREKELDDKYSVLKKSFLLGIKDGIKNRQFTMGMTSFIEDMTVFVMYLIIFFNISNGTYIDIKLESRRKSVESEFTKILAKSWELFCNLQQSDSQLIQPEVIRDRYGLRAIFSDNDPELLLTTTKNIVEILVNPDSENATKFRSWSNNCTTKFGGVSIPFDKINRIMEFDFKMDHVRDWITSPRDSNYQAWQCTFHISGTSPCLGGFMWELQSHNWSQYCKNESDEGPESHNLYKLNSTHGAIKAFHLDQYPNGLVFFNTSDLTKFDMDGITVPAVILSRHVSPHVI